MLELANMYPDIYITLGIHPESIDDSYQELEKIVFDNLNNDKFIAIGEIGLDYHYEGYNKVKQIELFEKQPQKFTENLEELELTVNEAEKIIELDSINKEIKYSCIKQLSEDDISSSIVICRFITNTFTPNSDFDFSDEIKFNLLLNEEIETSERIKFFKYNHSSLDSDEISEFIKSLGKEYEEITNKHKHAEISKNEANRVLLDVLKEVGYISSKSETKNGYRVNHHTMK